MSDFETSTFSEEDLEEILKKDLEETLKKKKGRPRQVPSIRGRHFFLTVPHFKGTLEQVLAGLAQHQSQWHYLRYAAVLQSHAQGDPHLHLYIAYPKLTYLKLNQFDYLGSHGKLERVRNYRAILMYMTKQSRPRANFNYIQEIMRKDFPRAVQILQSQGLSIRQIYRDYSTIVASKNWRGYLRFLQYTQQSKKFLDQKAKPGLCFIDQDLIRARLNDQQYTLFHSNPGFARIVQRINDIVRYGGYRPHKSLNLLISGAPNIGKSTLGLALARCVGTFTFPDDGWWQGYQSDVFSLILWNQFDLHRFAYPTLLKFLQGLRMDLPIKGSHVTRCDNPLIFMTSNLTLQQHICRRFASQDNRAFARANLSARIQCIDMGSTPLFLLLKLLGSTQHLSPT